MATTKGEWIVNCIGAANSRRFEISVIRWGNYRGQASYGWFDENKLLITKNKPSKRAVMPEFIWKKLIRLAHEAARELNESENKVCY